MKTVLGVLVGLLGVAFILCGFAGGVFAEVYCVVLAVMDIVKMANGELDFTFGNVFWIAVLWIGRGILAAIVALFSWFLGIACFAVATECL